MRGPRAAAGRRAPPACAAAPLGKGADVEQGETVVALGFAAGAAATDEVTSTRGVVSSASTTFRDPSPDVPGYREAVQTDTALNPGYSGGPLVDLDGRLVGVNAAARTTGSDGRPLEGQNYAIGIDRARRVLAELRQGRSIGWIGATFGYPTTEELLDRKLPPGLYLTGAVPGTPAARAGLGGRGELLAGVDGRPLASVADLLLRGGRRADRRAAAQAHARAAGRRQAARGRRWRWRDAGSPPGPRRRSPRSSPAAARAGWASPKALVELGGRPLRGVGARRGRWRRASRPSSWRSPAPRSRRSTCRCGRSPSSPSHPLAGVVAALERAAPAGRRRARLRHAVRPGRS